MMGIRRSDVRLLALETCMVLVGVLAALLVDGLRESRRLDEEARAATDRLLEEVRVNLRELESLDSVVTDRSGRLRALELELDGTVPLGKLTPRFGGYRSPDLSEGAWQRLSTGAVAEHVPPDLLQEAFELYALHRYFLGLDEQIGRLVYGELNLDPARARYGWAVALAIMEQQSNWAREFIPQYRDFIARWEGW
jgi:hypothetical protein